ncbi:MAG: hypothetical protein HRT45_19920, partial [Bdellovibrionales bacterium]|nr:hypothetical protein [Bdellovibrionales bacterium]
LFENEALQTEHNHEMKGLSSAWGLDYVKVSSKGFEHFEFAELPKRCLVEFLPDLEASDEAWKSLKALYA